MCTRRSLTGSTAASAGAPYLNCAATPGDVARALAWLRDLDTGPGGGYDVYDGSCRFSAVEAGSSACASAWPSVLKRSGDQRVLLVLPR